ncbi:MAG: Ca2+-dependent phosphoinositide-specific phospholipase C, partial [Verrucomicrobia bacterium]|nr:Ca2+-dependent phosphoinositide-specific phospholipase C [Verrucomicrobiota bacterium]
DSLFSFYALFSTTCLPFFGAGSVRGKILIVLNAPEPMQAYYTDVTPALKGRAMFVKAEPGSPEAAVVVSNDPMAEKTQDWIRRGYLVRTRADNATKEAAANDTSNRDAAFASGSHIITTDFPSPTPHPKTGYVVALPNGKSWRPNPITSEEGTN